MNLTNIAEYLNSSLSSATQLTERMYQAGLIYREHDEEDRRKVNFHITKMGLKKLKSIERARREKTKDILSLILEEDLQELNRIQEKILNKLRESEK